MEERYVQALEAVARRLCRTWRVLQIFLVIAAIVFATLSVLVISELARLNKTVERSKHLLDQAMRQLPR